MPSPKTIKYKKLLKRLEAQREAKLPFAIYRKPGRDSVWGVFQRDAEWYREVEVTTPGFYVAPFSEADTPGFNIRADFLFQSPLKTSPLEIHADAPPEDAAAREIHKGIVARAVAEIKAGSLTKVVLSRRSAHSFKGSLPEVFTAFLRSYPRAFCYLWYHPRVGCWAGASPELLLKFDGQVARTVSLAGTLPLASGPLPEWGIKEKHEQSVVTAYIEQAVREVGGAPQSGPVETVRAGSLWHLRTEVAATLDPEKAARLLRKLHPTPAVCGYPLEAAREWIRRLENYDREYYTGFLGETGLETEGGFEFYVNLRCLQFRKSQALVYTGGGVTEASDPDQEYLETLDKSRTVLAVLQNSGKTVG